MLKTGLAHEIGHICTLDQFIERQLQRIWDERLRDPLAFVPHDLREKVTPAEAERNNIECGGRAADYLKGTIRRTQVIRGSVLAYVGPGKCHDSQILAAAVDAGLKVHCLDVSRYACELAEESFRAQSVKIGLSPEVARTKYKVDRSEIQGALAETGKIGLDLDTVQIWYFSRVIGCLRPDSAKLVLRFLGWVSLSSIVDPDRKKSIVIINTLRDHNQGLQGCTTTLWRKKEMLFELEEGAGRPIMVSREERWPYYNQTVLAMTIKASQY